MKTDITFIIDKIYETVEKHRLGAGSYSRWMWQDGKGSREMGENPYGCADAANILYTINRFPRDPAERDAFVRNMQKMQGEDGLFHESTHFPIHTTAHVTGALELFDASPLKRPTALEKYLDTDELVKLLEGLNWTGNPWTDSHIGVGIYAIFNLMGLSTPEWEEKYFGWLYDDTDPENGCFCGKTKPAERTAAPYYYMAGTFHYLFNHEYARIPLRHPEKLIDFCLDMYNNRIFSQGFGREANFLEIDWVYCLTRASRQTPYRYGDIKDALTSFQKTQVEYFFDANYDKDESINDMHRLFGGVCTLAELQQALPGTMISLKPLRLVLDRRPFI